jgi:acyl carrier protein
MEIAEKLSAFIKQNFYAAQKLEIAADDSLLDMGIIDSTGVLELVAYLEEQFHVKIGDGEIVPENLDSIAAMIRFLQSKGVAL